MVSLENSPALWVGPPGPLMSLFVTLSSSSLMSSESHLVFSCSPLGNVDFSFHRGVLLKAPGCPQLPQIAGYVWKTQGFFHGD